MGNDSADPVSDCTNNETIIFPCEAWALHPRLREERRFKDWTRIRGREIARDTKSAKKAIQNNKKREKTNNKHGRARPTSWL